MEQSFGMSDAQNAVRYYGVGGEGISKTDECGGVSWSNRTCFEPGFALVHHSGLSIPCARACSDTSVCARSICLPAMNISGPR